MGAICVSAAQYENEELAHHKITLRHVGSDLITTGDNAGKYTDAQQVIIDCGAALDDVFITLTTLGAAKAYPISKADDLKAWLKAHGDASLTKYREIGGKRAYDT